MSLAGAYQSSHQPYRGTMPLGLRVPGYIPEIMNTISLNELIDREFTRADFGEVKLVTLPDKSKSKTMGAQSAWLQLGLRGSDWCCINNWSKAALIDFKHGAPGMIDAKPSAVVYVYTWLKEVQEQQRPSEQALEERLEFLKKTGFLPVGPGEQIAVLFESAAGRPDHSMYRCDEEGNPFVVYGSWPEAIARQANLPQGSVHSLDEKQTTSAIEDLKNSIQSRKWDRVAETEVTLARRQLALLEDHLKVAPPERTQSGAVIRRWFIEGGDTSSIAEFTKASDGWRRYATHNDAWYFAARINPTKRETMTYAEQDVAHVICDTDEQFHLELKHMAEFYGSQRTPDATGYEPGRTTYFFDTLFLRGQKWQMGNLVEPEVPDRDTSQVKVPLFLMLDCEHPDVAGMAAGTEVILPEAAYELDQYNPLAFVKHEVAAMLTTDGFDITVRIDQQVFKGLVKASNREVAA